MIAEIFVGGVGGGEGKPNKIPSLGIKRPLTWNKLLYREK